MKKILYIAASPKPETSSISKQVGRAFVTKLMENQPDCTLEELDLYTADIPLPKDCYFTGWVNLVSGAQYDALSEADRHAVTRMNDLCTQFQSADIYVIASPMWSLSFPSILKQYLDCIMLNNRLISLTDKGVNGLLGDRTRKMVYIQTSGGVYPKLLYGQLNFGVRYFHDIFKFLGIKDFTPILVQGTDMQSVGVDKALSEAADDFDDAVNKVCPPLPTKTSSCCSCCTDSSSASDGSN
jgi:FMN-dependent NADH-azoreductase